MKTVKFVVFVILLLAVVIPLGLAAEEPEGAGNNLSFPVIWAEGKTKTLRGTAGEDPVLNGVWWYWWGTAGTDPNITPLSCLPDPDDQNFCNDGEPGTVGDPPGPVSPEIPLVKAYIQKDLYNVWQAGTLDWPAYSGGQPLYVHRIDWGDNLESVDWTIKSMVRTEVVLFQDLVEPLTTYGMRHVDGWGISEVHGFAVDPVSGLPADGVEGVEATVYSHCPRLMIQKLNVERGDPLLTRLVWEPTVGWTDPGVADPLVNPPIFNEAVWAAEDGPGFYNAEINVKGRIIYGYTWNVRNNNDGLGDYRITFSFDQDCGGTPLNTYFLKDTTEIIMPIEEEESAVLTFAASAESEPGGGARAVLLPVEPDASGNLVGENLTYIDIHIYKRETGGGGGGNGGGGKPR